MSVISLYPPLWHKVIDPLLAEWDTRVANDAERAILHERGWLMEMPGATPPQEWAPSNCRARSDVAGTDHAPPERLGNPVALGASLHGARQLDWFYVGGVAALHLLALLALLPWFFSWTGVLLVPLGMYVFGTIGVCVGFHRLLTHRSFSCPRWLERTFVLLGACCLMESPPYWVAVHRRHHQFADDDRDPHSPLKSFLWSHFGWYLVRIDPKSRVELLQRYAKDVMRDPLYAFLERNHNWVALVAISWFAFFAAGWGAALALGASMEESLQFGASVLVWGVFVRSVEVFQATQCVNSITHLWGYRNYPTNDHSKNNFYVAMITTGEGWHNNHHADPRSARHGHLWWELDITWLTIRLLERAGLAWDVVRPSPHLVELKAADQPG
jgi:stearoyl-CoA desaturase (delta-9 desaturase)